MPKARALVDPTGQAGLKARIPPKRKGPRGWAVPGRLADVTALVQLLGLDPDQSSYDAGTLERQLKEPQSVTPPDDWETVAREHAELFRVTDGGRIHLRRRWLSEAGKEQPPLPQEEVNSILETAATLHSSQIEQDRLQTERERFKFDVRLAVASSVVAAIAGIANLVLTYYFQGR